MIIARRTLDSVVALVVGLLFMKAGLASGTEATCLGQWHFELSSPKPDKEAWLSKGSWCRAKNLPRTIDVEVQLGDDGRVVMSGNPYRPTDILTSAGLCDFKFEDIASGLPKNHELALQVDSSVSVVNGTARCSEYEPSKLDDSRSGISISIPVTGRRRSASLATRPAGYEHALSSVLHACRKRNPDALWKLMTAHFQSEINNRAAQLRKALPIAELRQLYGYRGRPKAFTGLAFLRYAIKNDNSADNPCSNVEQWKVKQSIPTARGYLVIIDRPQSFSFGLIFSKDNQIWHLDQITKSVSKKME